jgi:protocatechuate 3,4-dioxygenase alpha subunit
MTSSTQTLKETPSQTAGPYVHIGCTPDFAGVGTHGPDLGALMVTGPVKGKEITISGVIFDGTGTPLFDAMVEIWQADANGIFNSPMDGRGDPDPNFTGLGRSPVDLETGEFVFETVKPGRVPYPDGRLQAPHVTFWIVARGINIGLHTRMYFEDEPEANAEDPVLALIEHQHRANTLLAKSKGNDSYRFDIRLQGESETVFFDV